MPWLYNPTRRRLEYRDAHDRVLGWFGGQSSDTSDLLPQVLSWTAIALLIFVSAGVIYLSTVEWRDRRRRKAAEPRRRS